MAVDPKTNQPIQPGYPGVGLRNVGSYQVSGHPFITGSLMATDEEVKVSFPYVLLILIEYQVNSVLLFQ